MSMQQLIKQQPFILLLQDSSLVPFDPPLGIANLEGIVLNELILILPTRTSSLI
jgi:hypothetical protein